VKQFVENTLRPDGLLVIRLIAENSGDLVTSQLIATLWSSHPILILNHNAKIFIIKAKNFFLILFKLLNSFSHKKLNKKFNKNLNSGGTTRIDCTRINNNTNENGI
jgi:hypothetical protein